MKKLLVILFICMTACGKQVDKKNFEHPEKSTKVIQPEEYFIDSLNIGRPSFNKIEFAQYRTEDSVYVKINFYSRRGSSWLLKNKFHFLKDPIRNADPQLADFNNDGCQDLTYASGVPARGINDLRMLFIYSKEKDQLTFIKNSVHFPNLRYEKYLDCMSAFMVYGGSSSVFLKLHADTLKMFASVDISPEELVVSTYNNQGKERVIYVDSSHIGTQIRYKNFKPLIEDKDW